MAREPLQAWGSVSRVVALVYGYPLEVGGVETHLLSLIKGSDRRQYRYRVIGETGSVFQERALAAGADIVGWAPRSALDLGRAISLAKALRGSDILHMHSPRALVLGRLAMLAGRIPTVLTTHVPAAVMVKRRQMFYRRTETLLSRGVDRLIYVSSSAREKACAQSSTLGKKAVWIPNGVTPGPGGLRETTRARLGISSTEVLGICVARLEAQKGIRSLLEAFRDVLGCRLWLVGEGSERANLKHKASELGLLGRVQFLGMRSDVPALLAAADFFVLASEYEGMSIALLEAMAAGLPCLATDVGETRLMLSGPRVGLVVPPRDTAALSLEMGRLAIDRNLRSLLGREARERAKRWSEEGMVQQTTAVYASLG
jgi:glycosyltransferase involved in cell wall biosynthesis